MRTRGFSLLELLVVMAVIATLMALAAPAVTAINRGTHLTAGGNLLVDNLKLARQTAIAQNKPVEVRFYELPGEAGNPPAYRGLQLFIFDQPASVHPRPLAAIQKLPGVIVMAPGRGTDAGYARKFSLLLSDANQQEGSDTPPGLSTPTFYKAVLFLPSGSADLPPSVPGTSGEQWCISLKNENDPTQKDRPAHNFYTARLDAVSGHVQIYRP